MKFKTLFKTVLITFLAVTVFSCSDDDDTTFPSTSTTIADFVAENADYSSLLAALQKAELVETLSGNGPFTVFAPNNAAFDEFLTANGLTLETATKDQLTPILLNHVLNVKVTSGEIETGYVTNVADFSSYISKSGSEVKINNQATVTTADVDRSNGVIHAVDKVISIPKMIDFVAIDPNLSSLATVATDNSATVSSALSDEASSLTLLAPNNAAFTALGDVSGLSSTQLEQILLNHAISGKLQSTDLSTGYGNTLATYGTTDKNLSIYINTDGGVEFNGISTVTTANIVTSNGVIHIVDAVITLPTVVTFATADANFSTLVAALTTLTPSTEFDAILNTALGTSPAPFTVFVPNNDAFAAITVPTDENDVAAILNHHVVAGSNVTSDMLASTSMAMTLNGTITLTAMPPTVKGATNMDASNIVAADVQASNGVIHVIDQVLLPVM
ncbi:fasciclin domain-containing protein [Aquimarina sp. AU119]|uniref:fasciclin domain-containing protein n=1 Tax=Aquimarina sp. AU119 TaxID=2108528 RepID=UPI000D694A74|nr:fasciclin domain-containing protein [Aquimarina sp. AU119]